ncbi:MAG: DUF484 family protein [Thiotrichaceae bacterium]
MLSTTSSETLTDEAVIAYLKCYPQFFVQHEAVLTMLEIPHSRGNAVSLVERQLAVLRDENQQLQRKLENLIDIAKQNEQLNQRLQTIILNLTHVHSTDEFFNSLYDNFKREFNTDAITLRLFELPPAALAGRGEFVEYDADVFNLFEQFLSNNESFCGRLTPEQHGFLFPGVKIGSAVLIPIGLPKPRGLLAMGSHDVARFHAGMATDMLKYMGDLVSGLLNVWLRSLKN